MRGTFLKALLLAIIGFISNSCGSDGDCESGSTSSLTAANHGILSVSRSFRYIRNPCDIIISQTRKSARQRLFQSQRMSLPLSKLEMLAL